MANLITWGTFQYPETQVIEYAPILVGDRIQSFPRINSKSLKYLAEIPTKGYRVKLLFSSYSDSRNTANPALSKYEELESAYLNGTSSILTVAAISKGNHVITSIEGRFPFCAETGKPYIVEVDATWEEDPL